MAENEARSREEGEILFRLLTAFEKEGAQTHRNIARELGIALGLANAYIRRCVYRGYLKVQKAPARRYVYLLTPRGLSEKTRLGLRSLSSSFQFFQSARAECAQLLEQATKRGVRKIVLAGASDLAEVFGICVAGSDISIVGIVDHRSRKKTFMGYPVRSTLAQIEGDFDAIVVTDLRQPAQVYARMCNAVGDGRVLRPRMLEFTSGGAK